jgi:hypothetical protein
MIIGLAPGESCSLEGARSAIFSDAYGMFSKALLPRNDQDPSIDEDD